MNIIDFFDVTNLEHLRAYQQLLITGIWPKGFIPEDIEFVTNWQIIISNKLASEYIMQSIDLETS